MRVLVVTTVHTPLDARIHRRQIGALVAAGHDVVYAAPWHGYGIPLAAAGEGVTPVNLPRACGRRRLTALLAARRVIDGPGRHADVVLLHDPELLLALPGLRRLPTVVWDVHEDVAASLIDRDWVPAWLRRSAAQLARAAEGVAERRLRLVLAEDGYRGRFAGDHPVVPNVPYLPPPPPPPGDDRVVYLGRVSASRGARQLVALAERLPRKVSLEVIGTADRDVRPVMAAAAAAGKLDWHGFVPNELALARLPGALAGLALVADQPNHRVSRLTKVLEYAAHGIPVVATPLPAVRSFVDEHRAGVLVPFGDVDAVVDAILRLRADAAEREAMARRGRAAVERHYTWDVEGPRFVALLESWA